MKLWLKISIICAAVLLLTVGICSALLLFTSREKILAIAVRSTESVQFDLSNSFKEMVTHYGSNDLGPIEKRSLVKYCFRNFTDDTSVLISGDDTLYSSISFDPANILALPVTGEQAYTLKKIGSMDYVIAGSKLTVLTDQYSIYTVRDITDVYESISQLVWQFCVISGFCITAGIILIIILILYAAKPLKELGFTVGRIAKGEYSERATVKTRDEIGQLAQDFNSMAQAVQTHVETLKETAMRQQLFIGALTHEFKTPLTSVIGHSETLLYTKMPQETVERSLFYIHEQCTWLERLTQKLLKLITLAEEIKLENKSVEELFDAVRISMEETLLKRGVNLQSICEISELPMDDDLMLSLIINLVDNASKASSPGQTVIMHAYGHTIEVTDKGIGIPGDELAMVFDPFYMVDKSRSKKMGGVGLGLAISKKIAEAHGANIKMESAAGLGTTVKVIFSDNNTFTSS
jgi:two-component system phosphate regulon sensor histidine kinase PhoR